MLCENCGKREANVRYQENINGITRELNLCEECSNKLGITKNMNMDLFAMDLPSFFGSFLEDFESDDIMKVLGETKTTRCKSCNSSFDDIIMTGMLGCPNCYDTFDIKLDQILKRIQGANRHIGRLGKISDNKIKLEENKVISNNENNKNEKTKKDKLEEELKKAIKDERYEDAAKIRDEIKNMEKEK